MKQAKSGDALIGDRIGEGKMVPFYSVGIDEWREVPGALPNMLVILASWVPLIALNIYLFRFAFPQRPEMEVGKLLTFSVIAACIAIMWAAARIAPWLALAATSMLYVILQPTGTAQLVVLACASWFALLALSGMINQWRLILRLRRWRAHATSTVLIPSEQLRQLRIYRQLPTTLWYLALGSILYPLLKLTWQFLTDAEQVFSSLDRERIDGFLIGSVALGLCLIVLLVRWVEQGIVGHIALEVPLTSDFGPLSFVAIGASVAREPENGARCECTDPNEDSKSSEYEQFVECLDRCSVHGVGAVNALSEAEFTRIADQPWVYGEHANDRLLRKSARLVIAGFSGWDSKPVRLQVDTVFGQGSVAPANYRPKRATEPLCRAKRRLSWRNCADTPLVVEEFNPATMRVLDQIPLGTLGLTGYAVRVAGRRPFLVDHPVR
ncbi:hypothetical protein [Glutamicibacter ardleyensis]|uniref:hypothetical protein n=1 Tax=Glutamicibacter ardleyensis TaxID=225894 RepID=UPI003FD5B07F